MSSLSGDGMLRPFRVLLCYTCGFIERANETEGAECPKCHVWYCGNCLPTVQTCFSCGFERSEGHVKPHLVELSLLSVALGQRRHLRREYRATIEYSMPLRGKEDAGPCRFKGVTHNISASGFCMFTIENLAQGQVIQIPRSFRTGNNSSAEVRWIRKVSEIMYSAGLMFRE